jgi:hypothetical protein
VRRVGRYEILREVGRGGMATVYLARQRDLDREVALKELTLASGPDPADARRFLREARLAGSFSHPNIVTVHDYFERGGTPYIAMEYLERGALRPYVGRLSLEQVGGVLEDLLAGLAHAAERGVVHRDVKPENLMVTMQGRTKIADFGIAKASGAAAQTTNLTIAGSTLGTPRYMAPERALGQEIGPWSDLYSVGVLAFELLVGRTPFHDTEEPMAVLMRQINDPIPRVDTLVPDVDPLLADWIDRLVVKDPLQRTRAPQAALNELDEVLIDRLGPRWPRRASLPAHPGDPTTSLAPADVAARADRAAPDSSPVRATRPGRGSSARGRAASRRDDVGARAASRRDDAGGRAASGRAARGASRGGDSSARRAAAIAALGDDAVTVAPATIARPRSRQAGHRRLLLALAGLIVATIAAGRLLGGGGPAGGGPEGPSSSKSPSERAKTAGALAEEYDRRADDAGSRTQAGRYQRVADAYRRAADAVKREDGSDYDDAVADARAGERALAKRRAGGVGDSQSDDPSDDQPDGPED